MRNYFEKKVIFQGRLTPRTLYEIYGEQSKCVKLCVIEPRLFISHKNVKPSHFHDVIEKEVFDSNSKENHFVVSKVLNFLDHCSCYTKTRNFVLSYSTLKQ